MNNLFQPIICNAFYDVLTAMSSGTPTFIVVLFLGYMMMQTRNDIKDLRKDMETGFKEVRTELKADIAAVRTELKAEIKELSLRVEHRFEKNEIRIENLEKQQDQIRKSKSA